MVLSEFRLEWTDNYDGDDVYSMNALGGVYLEALGNGMSGYAYKGNADLSCMNRMLR